MSEYTNATAPFMGETFTKHPSRKKNFQVKIQCCVQSYYTAAQGATIVGVRGQVCPSKSEKVFKRDFRLDNLRVKPFPNAKCCHHCHMNRLSMAAEPPACRNLVAKTSFTFGLSNIRREVKEILVIAVYMS